jgi:hypothetical protein
MSGKGSSPRPFSVSQDTFASNYEAIFGKKKPKCEHCGKTDCPHAIDSAKDCVYTNNTQSQQGK